MEYMNLLGEGKKATQKNNRRRHEAVTFKPYEQNRMELLPPSLDELIPQNHMVRVVNETLNKVDISEIIASYKGGGTSSYHPLMLLKLIVYGYTQRTFSCRTLAKAARENIYFMWLTGGNKPDFRTINRFIQTMANHIDGIFVSVVEILLKTGHIKFEKFFIDGTKIEANANKYTFVFSKNTKRYKEQVQEKALALLTEARKLNAAENSEYGNKDLDELGDATSITSEELTKKLDELESDLAAKPKVKGLKKRVRLLRNDCLPRLAKYEEQEAILSGRRSYSKTDHDAVFMRMKEDHMRNGQLKPAYNVQMTTEGEFIVNYSIHQKPGDTTCLIPHLEKSKELYGRKPEKVIADAGYGSEENLVYLEKEDVAAYVKYNTFHLEQKRSFSKKAFNFENWTYLEETDQYICPAGKFLNYRYTSNPKTETDYRTEKRVYEASDCGTCPLRSQCTKGKGNRKISVSPKLKALRESVAERLKSEEGVKLRGERAVYCEGAYSHIKYHWGFRRFTYRGLSKVGCQWGLLCIAHNLNKLWKAA